MPKFLLQGNENVRLPLQLIIKVIQRLHHNMATTQSNPIAIAFVACILTNTATPTISKADVTPNGNTHIQALRALVQIVSLTAAIIVSHFETSSF